MKNARNAYSFGCETRQKLHERCNELGSQLDAANTKIESLTTAMREESAKNRQALNKVLAVVQKVMPEAMDQVNINTLEFSVFLCHCRNSFTGSRRRRFCDRSDGRWWGGVTQARRCI